MILSGKIDVLDKKIDTLKSTGISLGKRFSYQNKEEKRDSHEIIFFTTSGGKLI
jgi:hypothetical protein